MFFGEKDLGVTEQLGLIGGGESIEDGKIPLQNPPPFLRNGLGAEARAATRFEQVEPHPED
jgi:hypothetical protein